MFSHPFPDNIATEDYYIWEFYKASPEELILSTLLGTASVSFLALLFIPHWSAVFIVCFMLSVLYVDLMGFIQLCGVSVSPVMYISMIMSIGLMVDYVMHVTYVPIFLRKEILAFGSKVGFVFPLLIAFVHFSALLSSQQIPVHGSPVAQ